MIDKISILCTAESHPTKRASVMAFAADDRGRWVMIQDRRNGARAMENRQPRMAMMADGNFTPRYRLDCKLCGLNASIRDPLMMEILDATAAAGVSVLPLAVVVARVSST